MLPVVLLLAAAPCVTPCGLRAGAEHCADLKRFERRVLTAFRGIDHWTPDLVCKAFKGWTIEQRPEHPKNSRCAAAHGDPRGWWAAPVNLCVYAWTDPKPKMIYVQGTDWRRNSLAHELVHVVDFTVFSSAGHCAWAKRGILSVMLALTDEVDQTRPEKDCPCAP